MNKAIIIGRLARDPEAFTTQSGIPRSTLTIAVRRRYRNESGQYDADFLTVVAWRQTADYCNKYLRKGSRVAVEGSIQTRSYTAQDGNKRYVTEIIADEIEGLDPRREDGNGAPVSGMPQNNAQQPQNADGEFTEVEDELPF